MRRAVQTPPKGRSTLTPAAASRERAEGVGAGPRRQATRPPKGREGGRGDLSSDSVPEPQCCGFLSDARFSEGDFDPRAWLIRPAAQTRNAGVTLMPRQGRGPGSPCTQRCVGRLLAVPGAVTSWRWGALLVTCALPARPVPSPHRAVDGATEQEWLGSGRRTRGGREPGARPLCPQVIPSADMRGDVGTWLV